MNNLIIGNTSQLSYYFPENYERISSRNIDKSKIISGNFSKVFITFAEQRTFLKETEKFFTDINFDYTLKIIDTIKDFVNSVVVYSTSELWNNLDGKVSIKDTFNYNYTPYIKSKEILSSHIMEYKEKYQNVHIVYPFNFNSPYRHSDFLFGKIFNSIKNKKKISVGNLDFNRDIIHPTIVVNNSINTKNDILVGSGELINIKNFVSKILNNFNLNYDEIIKEENFNFNYRKEYYSEIRYSNFNELLNLTVNDLRKNNFS